MKSLNIFSDPDRLNHKEASKYVRPVQIVKTIILVVMLLGTTLLSSCLIPGPGHGKSMYQPRHNERQEQNKNHGNNGQGGQNNGNGHHK